MSSDFVIILRGLFSILWSLMTSFKLPGLNFSPAVLMFGIMSFGLAIKLLSGIFTITTGGINARQTISRGDKND